MPTSHVPQQPHSSFFGLGIAPKILEVLDRLKFTVPTPIQHKAIPAGLEGKDVIGVAQTGTGKTLAFAIPIIQQLSQRPKGRALVLVPTRELAIQVDETFQKVTPAFAMKTAVLIGGSPMQPQVQALRRMPRVIIATPGRLVDHIEQGTVMLADVAILVLDEADRMLDMGFLPQIERVLRYIPKMRQTMLFSATMPQAILSIATAHMKLPVHVEVAPSGTTAERIAQELYIVRHEAKKDLIKRILDQYNGSVLLFTRTKIGAMKVTRALRKMGYNAAEIHSDRSLSQRREALEGFKTGKYRILCATDVAARGIDVKEIELVVNYDIPEDPENYVHRIGRTGRAGHEGRAISLATPEQLFEVRSIEKLIKIPIPVAEHPEFPRERFSEGQGSGGSHGRGGYGRQQGRQPRRFGGHGQQHGGQQGGQQGGHRQHSNRQPQRSGGHPQQAQHAKRPAHQQPSPAAPQHGGHRAPAPHQGHTRPPAHEEPRRGYIPDIQL